MVVKPTAPAGLPATLPAHHILVSSGGQLLVASSAKPAIPPLSVSPLVTSVTAAMTQVPSLVGGRGHSDGLEMCNLSLVLSLRVLIAQAILTESLVLSEKLHIYCIPGFLKYGNDLFSPLLTALVCNVRIGSRLLA